MTDNEEMIYELRTKLLSKFDYMQFLDFCIWFANKVDNCELAKFSDPSDIIYVWERDHG